MLEKIGAVLLLLIFVSLSFYLLRQVLIKKEKRIADFYENKVPDLHLTINNIVDGLEVKGDNLKHLHTFGFFEDSSSFDVEVLLKSKKGNFFIARYKVFTRSLSNELVNIKRCDEDDIKVKLSDDVKAYKRIFSSIEVA